MFNPEVKSIVGEDISILIRLDNYSSSFLCECGDASKLTPRDCKNLEVIFISHTHIDHFINFDTILRHQVGIERKVIICGPEGIIDRVCAKINAYTWNLIEKDSIVYEVREIIHEKLIRRHEIYPPDWKVQTLEPITENIVYQNNHLQVNFTILDHKIPSIAYLFKENDGVKINLDESEFKGGSWIKALKAAYKQNEPSKAIQIHDKTYAAQDLYHLLIPKKGKTLGIIMDHLACKANHDKIIELFSHCDKVFIESFYNEEDKESAQVHYHSYSKESARIMKLCHVKKAIPVHFSRKYNEEEVKALIKEFEEVFYDKIPSLIENNTPKDTKNE